MSSAAGEILSWLCFRASEDARENTGGGPDGGKSGLARSFDGLPILVGELSGHIIFVLRLHRVDPTEN